MKLDKLKFAMVIGFIQRQYAISFSVNELYEIDNMIDVDVPVADVKYPLARDVDDLLRQLNAPDGFIPAIKAYRNLTGQGLKESKEAIERYRSIPKFPKDDPIGN